MNGGMSLGSVLLVLFVALKLLGKITWSWLWVLSPLWISAIIFLLMLLVLIILEIRW